MVVERVDAAPLLGFPPAEVDEDAARDFAAATAELLDAHLNDLQTGKGGALQATAPAGLAEALDAGIPGVSDLATPDRPVERARYLLRVHLDDRVRALAAVVTVVDSTGAERTAELGFVPDGDGAPALAMVPAPPPPPA